MASRTITKTCLHLKIHTSGTPHNVPGVTTAAATNYNYILVYDTTGSGEVKVETDKKRHMTYTT